MEKQGVIKPGITPPEGSGEKQASAEELEAHVTKRASDAALNTLDKGTSCGCKPTETGSSCHRAGTDY